LFLLLLPRIVIYIEQQVEVCILVFLKQQHKGNTPPKFWSLVVLTMMAFLAETGLQQTFLKYWNHTLNSFMISYFIRYSTIVIILALAHK